MSVIFYYLLLHLHGLLFITCIAQKVSNLYVFGDSMVDYGYKTLHKSGMTPGYRPYGMECFWTDAERFTNGQTIPEIIASSLNIKSPVTFDRAGVEPERGINYASASAGILPETGSALGKNYYVGKQIISFRETVENVLRPKLQSKDKLSDYLSSSIYLINIGSSDYTHNYLQPYDYDSSSQYNGEDFAELLTRKLGNNLKDLYNLGARKIIIFQIGPLGCFPYIINRVKPRSRCAEDVNRMVSIFNDKLNAKLNELSEKLHGSMFVTVRTFDLIRSMIQNPIDYGFKDTRWPCCPTQENGTGLCKEIKYYEASPTKMAQLKLDLEQNQREYQRQYHCMDAPLTVSSRSEVGKRSEDVCNDRKFYLFWDELHLTEAAYKIIVNKCLASSDDICSPSNILQ